MHIYSEYPELLRNSCCNCVFVLDRDETQSIAMNGLRHMVSVIDEKYMAIILLEMEGCSMCHE